MYDKLRLMFWQIYKPNGSFPLSRMAHSHLSFSGNWITWFKTTFRYCERTTPSLPHRPFHAGFSLCRKCRYCAQDGEWLNRRYLPMPKVIGVQTPARTGNVLMKMESSTKPVYYPAWRPDATTSWACLYKIQDSFRWFSKDKLTFVSPT